MSTLITFMLNHLNCLMLFQFCRFFFLSLFLFQFSSVTQCRTLCDPMNRSTPDLPIHHQLPKFTQTHIHWVSGAIQPSHPLSSPSPPALNLSQHQGLLKWVSSSHQVAKVLEFQLQHQSHQWHSCYSCVLKFTNLFFSAMSHHLLILLPVFFILRCCSFNL